MENVLLLGNGMNRVTQNNKYSWEDLLKNLIAKFCCGNVNLDSKNLKPFPLLYEEILSYAIFNNSGNEKSIKDFICSEIKKIKSNSCHKLLKRDFFVSFMTTNYDYLIEEAIAGKIKFRNVGQVEETTYSLLRNKRGKNIIPSIWHIHGESNIPNTITLGYEHYAGYLQNIRQSVMRGKEWKNFELDSLWRRLESDEVLTWVDFFFSHNVHIVGLSLDYSEMDLWWLLVYRSRQKNNRLNKKAKYEIQNRLYYYYAKSPDKSPELDMHERNRLEILTSLDVILVPIELHGDDYQRFYKELFESELRI